MVRRSQWRRLIRADEAAELLGIERRTLYNWVQAGRVPVVRLSPKTIRFDVDALREWIDERADVVGGAS